MSDSQINNSSDGRSFGYTSQQMVSQMQLEVGEMLERSRRVFMQIPPPTTVVSPNTEELLEQNRRISMPICEHTAVTQNTHEWTFNIYGSTVYPCNPITITMTENCLTILSL